MDVDSFIEEQRHAIEEEKKRLGIIDPPAEEQHEKTFLVSKEPKTSDEKENVPVHNSIVTGTPENTKKQNAPLDQVLDLSCITDPEDSLSGLQANQQQFHFRTDDSKRTMLRYGDYSPNNPELRVTAAPYLGLGEYEQRRELLLRQRQKDHKEYINSRNQRIKSSSINLNKVKLSSPGSHKSVQTDLQNINNKLIQYSSTQKTDTAVSGNLSTSGPPTIETTRNVVMHNNRSPVLHRLDQRITAAHNSLLKPEMVDKPRGILTNRRTESPRERLMSDLKHSYVPTLMDGFSFSDRADDMERERIKREIYQNELRLQIEEKRRIVAMREEQERREQELENRRLEQQLLRMQEEQLRDEQRRNRREQMRRNSDDYASRKQEIQQQSRPYRKHTDSESSVSNIRSSTNVASKLSSHYSPPMSRRNVPFSFNVPSTSLFAEPSTRYNPSRYDSFLRNRMDSLNVPQDTYYSPKPPQPTSSSSSPFGRYDSLSRIDSLKQQEALNRLENLSISDSLSRVQRRHSATQQDLSMIRRSPKLQRRSSSSRFEDSLPIPVLKAHSPVARELKNSIAVNSTRHGSDAVRRLEDKWQIPAVQKNVINHGDVKGGQSRNVLTQLGAIRMQLQREQLRMDETLERRSIQSKAVH